jgi:hypothetical protein
MGLWGGLPAGAQGNPAGKVKVFVGINPVAYFVERVGSPFVEVIAGRHSLRELAIQSVINV